ncbi:MAG: hypothetical protein R3B07_02145 [Polyangiaceae bacterium]
MTLVGNDSGGYDLPDGRGASSMWSRAWCRRTATHEVFPPKEFAFGVVGRSQTLLRLTSWLLQRSKALRHGPLTFGA